VILANNFQTEYQSIQKEIDDAIHRVLTSGWYILGKEVEQFEQEFAQYLGVKHVIGVGNGMEALQIGLMAMGIGPGDEIITTPLSAVATALAISNIGATPIFADVDEYYHLDPTCVEKLITKKTKAVLPVHLYGQPVDLDGFRLLCKKHKLALIEDAAQAHGAEYKGRKVGSFGLFSAFSFYPTKNLGAFGDGGAIATNDDGLRDSCSMIRNYGQKKQYEHLVRGLNSRLDELQAAVLRVKLIHLDEWNEKRRNIAQKYNEAFNNHLNISTPRERSNTVHPYHQYVISVESRDALISELRNKNITTLVHYPIPIHRQPCYAEYNNLDLPKSQFATKNILSLPIHPFMTTGEVGQVIKEVLNLTKL